MWIYYNPNPAGRLVGDCAIRALSKALNVDWKTAYLLATNAGFNMCDMPSSDAVTSAVLRQNGFKRANFPYSENYTIHDFCRDNPIGVFVIYTGGHVVTAIDGDYYDMWNSGDEIPLHVWYDSIKPNTFNKE